MRLLLETSAVCNLRCKMCPTIAYDCNKGIMSDRTFERLIPFFDLFEEVDLTGWGEPLLDNKIFERINVINDFGCKTSFTTNAVLLDKKNIKKILDSPISGVHFSMDSANPDNYKEIRKNSQFSIVSNNINNFLNENKRLKNKKHTSIGVMLMKSNIKELKYLIKFINTLDIDLVSFNDLGIVSTAEQLADIVSKRKLKNVFEKLKKQIKPSVKVMSWNIDDKPRGTCLDMPGKGIFISWDGKVSPCCILGHDAPLYYENFYQTRKIDNVRFNFGDVNREDLDKILKKEILNKIIQGIKNEKPLKICDHCRLYLNS